MQLRNTFSFPQLAATLPTEIASHCSHCWKGLFQIWSCFSFSHSTSRYIHDQLSKCFLPSKEDLANVRTSHCKRRNAITQDMFAWNEGVAFRQDVPRNEQCAEKLACDTMESVGKAKTADRTRGCHGGLHKNFSGAAGSSERQRFWARGYLFLPALWSSELFFSSVNCRQSGFLEFSCDLSWTWANLRKMLKHALSAWFCSRWVCSSATTVCSEQKGLTCWTKANQPAMKQ